VYELDQFNKIEEAARFLKKGESQFVNVIIEDQNKKLRFIIIKISKISEEPMSEKGVQKMLHDYGV
jgi:tRNA threonylcarbamoyladenosine modification (KEOPS) complex Cgi121 subunit